MKLILTESWIYAGKHYGPGEVEIEDEAAAKAIAAKMAAAKAATPEAQSGQIEIPDSGSIASASGSTLSGTASADDPRAQQRDKSAR